MKPTNEYFTISLAILLFTITGCASKRTGFNNKSYSINRSHTHSGNLDPILYGYVVEYPLKVPVLGSRVYVGKDLKGQIESKEGYYSFPMKPGKYRFNGVCVGYYITRTRRIKVSKGDSVRIDFNLKIDDRPLIN